MSEQTQVQKFCCWNWKQRIEDKTLITKEQAFDNGKSLESEFYKIHPNFIMWVDDDHNVNKIGWHWFHFCPNCGEQKDSNENIEAWRRYWNNNK
jgi:hypothetical protein